MCDTGQNAGRVTGQNCISRPVEPGVGLRSGYNPRVDSEHYKAPNNEGSENARIKKQTLVPFGFPALQIKGGPIRNKDKKIHESIKAFLNRFEVQLKAHGLSLDDQWERLFWLTCDDLQRSWFGRTLAERNYAWQQVREHLEKAFGNPYYLWKKRHEVRNLHQKPGESLRLYTERFQEIAFDAGLEDGEELVWNYVSSLQRPIREKVWSTLTNHYGLEQLNNLSQVAQLIMATTGEDTYLHSDSESAEEGVPKRRPHLTPRSSSPDPHFKQSRKRFKRGNCPLHPKGNHNQEDCKLLEQFTKGSRASMHAPWNEVVQKPAPAQSIQEHKKSALCKYCKKVPYIRGHTCPEYYQAKHAEKSRL